MKVVSRARRGNGVARKAGERATHRGGELVAQLAGRVTLVRLDPVGPVAAETCGGEGEKVGEREHNLEEGGEVEREGGGMKTRGRIFDRHSCSGHFMRFRNCKMNFKNS